MAALAAWTTSHYTELIAFTKAPTLAIDKIINVCTDFKYAYNILSSNAYIFYQRELLTAKNITIHFRGHQRLTHMIKISDTSFMEIMRLIEWQNKQLPICLYTPIPIPSHVFLFRPRITSTQRTESTTIFP